MSNKLIAKKEYRRLDDFLVESLSINKSKVNKMIKSNIVYINDLMCTKNGQTINTNDVIEIRENNKQEIINELVEYEINLDIKFEDEDLIIVYKPSGLLTHATLYNEKETLMNALFFYSKKQWKPHMIHRLDKDTSGLVIFAKNEKTQSHMLEKFQKRQIIKKYYAIVNQPIKTEHFFIDVPISRSSDNKMKMIAGNFKNAKEALTEVKLIKNWTKFSLVDVTLHTGRTHQIRVHLKYINHPIFNDPLYSFNKSDNLYNQYLMAYYLEFKHPISNNDIKIEIDMDREFNELIEKLY